MCNKRIVKVFLLLFALAATQVQCKHQQQQSGNRRNRNSGKSFSYLNTTINANLFSFTHANHAHFRNSFSISQSCMSSWLTLLGKLPALRTTTATIYLSTSHVTDQMLLPRSLQKVRQLSLTYLCLVLKKYVGNFWKTFRGFKENAQNSEKSFRVSWR